MRKYVLLTVLLAVNAHAAEKIFLVEGQKVTSKQAILAGMSNKKVQRCSIMDAEIIVDGKVVKNAMKCQEVSLYESKSGAPTWKASSTGTKW